MLGVPSVYRATPRDVRSPPSETGARSRTDRGGEAGAIVGGDGIPLSRRLLLLRDTPPPPLLSGLSRGSRGAEAASSWRCRVDGGDGGDGNFPP